jgi:hypothetical protein
MTKNNKAPLIVVERKSWRWYAWIGFWAVLAAFLIFHMGRLEDRMSRSSLTHQRDRLQAKVDELQQKLLDYEAVQAQAQQSQAVDDIASSELKQTLKTLQDSVKELEKDNAFYRGIMNPQDEKTGLAIDSFSVINYGGDNRFRYKLVLTQLRKHESNLRGKTRVLVNGSENGVAKTYDLFVLAGLKSDSIGFDFRYFQNLEGDVTLPAGFVAREVRVSAMADGKSTAERVFPWE